jgi:hypothetical protein
MVEWGRSYRLRKCFFKTVLSHISSVGLTARVVGFIDLMCVKAVSSSDGVLVDVLLLKFASNICKVKHPKNQVSSGHCS